MQWRREQGLDCDVVYKPKKKLYGRRDASAGFAEFVRDKMEAIGFEQCVGQPSFHRHVAIIIRLELHQDDFHVTASHEEIEKLKNEMNGVLILKWSIPLEEGSSYGHLNCHRARLADGTWILGNPNYEKAIIEELGMENAKPSPMPTTSTRSAEEVDSPKLDATLTTKFRRCVGIARFMRNFRGDINFVVKELSHGLAAPN
eukprot:13914125-Heterocapsa_arctica.AAC.1